MPLGKRLGRPPREVAAELVGRLDASDVCEPPEVAGPGFINLRIRTSWLAEQVAAALSDPRLGVAPSPVPRSFVLDYSAPNVAKPMHVGHIRSTVIGDALCRMLRFAGHQVISDNHIGDWGTQFGMILYGYKHLLDREAYRPHAGRRVGPALSAGPRAGRRAARRGGGRAGRDRQAARRRPGEPAAVAGVPAPSAWKTSSGSTGGWASRFDHTLGESFYNDQLAAMVEELLDRAASPAPATGPSACSSKAARRR